MSDKLPDWTIAAADQADADILRRAKSFAQAALAENGGSLDILTEDEAIVLSLGIRCGAMAHLAWQRDRR